MIRARDLRYTHPDGTLAVDRVDLTVTAGERVAVLGANGSGKTTLQLLLGGLERPDAGRVTYFGGESDADAVRDRLAVLTQSAEDYLFNATVREDLEYGPAQVGMPREVARERIDDLRSTLDLSGLLDRPPFRLSAGEQGRAALGAALAAAPDLLLLDEPTSDLDGSSRERVLARLDSFAADGHTLLTFTPSPALVTRIADRVLLLDDGAVVARGPVREVLTDVDLLARHGLRPPPAVRLLDGLVDEPPLTVDAARDLLSGRLSGDSGPR